jgi:hypothetical protein
MAQMAFAEHHDMIKAFPADRVLRTRFARVPGSTRACFQAIRCEPASLPAAGKGASIFKMMDVSRHKSVDTLRGYVRDAELFKDHAGAGLL